MKEGKCDKYAKLTLYSFISKFMSECATKLGQMKLKTEINRTVGLKLKNGTASVRRKERAVAGKRRLVTKK